MKNIEFWVRFGQKKLYSDDFPSFCPTKARFGKNKIYDVRKNALWTIVVSFGQ